MKNAPGVNLGLDTNEIVQAYHACGGKVAPVARQFGVNRKTIYGHLDKVGARLKKPLVGGSVKGLQTIKATAHGEVKRFIFTAAQNNTKVPPSLWDNLLALKEHYQAELIVGTFTYNKNAYGESSVKKGTWAPSSDLPWYDQAIMPYIRDERIEVAPGLIWCGEMNILPTAARPLSALGTYTGPASSIFPHAKIAMESIPTSKYDRPKFTFTTGCCTMKNYIQKLAGLKAEFHHAYGALLVEVDTDGEWFARQLNADNRWRIYDIDIVVENGKVSPSSGVEAVVWGDIHAARADEEIHAAVFNQGGVLDQLRPKTQFMHDILDFHARSHHEVKDHFAMWQRHVDGSNDVAKELRKTVDFLHLSSRDWCETVVVNSNHDRHMERWLKEQDFRQDPVNAKFHLQATTAWYTAIENEDTDFLLLEWALNTMGLISPTTFLKRDESRIINGIEHGMHGDEGPNGVRGTPMNLANMGRKLTMADKHTATIHDGVYVAGTFSRLDMGYNHGPSSWSHSFVILHRNGKRQMVTMRGARWRVQ